MTRARMGRACRRHIMAYISEKLVSLVLALGVSAASFSAYII
jgi:hypothetical protein